MISRPGAYREEDGTAPLGVYGASKLAGEKVLRDRLPRHIILRTSWVFSATGNNFVSSMLRLGRERSGLAIVDDQHGSPTSARSIDAVLLQIADRYLRGEVVEWGTYHYCGQPETTWLGFAKAIFQHAQDFDKPKLKGIPAREYPTPASRPGNSVLDCHKFEKAFGLQRPDWIDDLRSVLKVLES